MLREALGSQRFTDCGSWLTAAKRPRPSYGPFRDAAGSAPRFGDRKSCTFRWIPPTAGRPAENFLDLDEGAEVLLVKPAPREPRYFARTQRTTVAPLAVYLCPPASTPSAEMRRRSLPAGRRAQPWKPTCPANGPALISSSRMRCSSLRHSSNAMTTKPILLLWHPEARDLPSGPIGGGYRLVLTVVSDRGETLLRESLAPFP